MEHPFLSDDLNMTIHVQSGHVICQKWLLRPSRVKKNFSNIKAEWGYNLVLGAKPGINASRGNDINK